MATISSSVRSPTPVPAAQHYLELTAGERPEAAYALLDESFRRRCDRPCFARLTASQREDAHRTLAELRAGATPRVEQLIAREGLNVKRLPMTELCEKAGGASRCLVCVFNDAPSDLAIPEAFRLSTVARAMGG